MSFDYDKLKAKDGDHGSWWTSYADLFMMLSIVFLLMYVASSLRNGSAGFQQQSEYRKLAQRAQELEEQIKVYNTLKDESLRSQASDEEQKVYEKLMSRLSLLKDEAQAEKLALREKARENEEKEFALNQYQQIVRNIINANILAKSQIIHRDQVIIRKDMTIEEKRQKMAEMEQVIVRDERRIREINMELDGRIAELRAEQRRSRSSRMNLEKRIASLRAASEQKINEIEENRRSIDRQLSAVRGSLAETAARLNETTETLGQRERENALLASKLEEDRKRYLSELSSLRKEHQGKLESEKAAFMASLKKQRLDAAARAARLEAFGRRAAQKAAEFEGSLAGLQEKIKATEGRLRDAEQNVVGAEARLAGAQRKIAGAEAEKARALAAVEDLKGDLARTKAIANARRELANRISEQFGKAGLKGVVDAGTGEVTLDFDGEYFDSGSTSLKPRMKSILDKFLPVYAGSLFKDPKLAEKIANIEIVGFASSTYKGRYVNPRSTRESDKEAIQYNLNLSFGRANSIFKHVLDQNQLSQSERDRILPLLKVVGRGYLPEGKSAADIPQDIPEKRFCEMYNCKKAQKVIVKFNMKD